ncbi:MAG: DUF2569 family protein [Pantoea sp.]|uniref:DUF2569 family protein n=1 Tax=Pantoea sp. TaxID=69393 RepID=UPI0039E46542
MSDSGLSGGNKNESFGLFLIIIALSGCYIMITRLGLIINFWNIFLSLESESRVKGYFILSLISFSVTVLLSLWFVFSFFRKKKSTRYVFLSLVLIYLFFDAASYLYGTYVVGIDIGVLIQGYVRNLIIDTIILLFIFTPYIFFSGKSKRVFIRS